MSGPGVGGIETFFFDGIVALHEAGLAQHAIIHAEAPPGQKARLEALGLPYSMASFNRWWPASTRAVYGAAHKRFRPNLAQFWTGRAAHFAASRTECRNIGWFGGYRQMKDFKTCEHFVGITPDLIHHIGEGGADPAKTALVHTFSALPEARPVAVPRESLATPEDVPLLLILARLHHKKGIDTLLKALVKVPEAFLWIAGEGESRREYEDLAKALGLDKRVRFLGWRTDRAELLAAADICVMPSRFEPFGTVMVEAWQAGKPLIVAAAQGPRAYVKNEANGLMVAIDDSDALARAIGRLIEEPELRARIVAGGRQTYDASFTKAAYVRGMLEFYRKVLERS
jgi:glycosyltransferase involved in cell wall biosynthesis